MQTVPVTWLNGLFRVKAKVASSKGKHTGAQLVEKRCDRECSGSTATDKMVLMLIAR